jgi:hypothetical protein
MGYVNFLQQGKHFHFNLKTCGFYQKATKAWMQSNSKKAKWFEA